MEGFYNKTLFLHSTLSMEINPFFTGNSNSKIEFVDIAQDTRFPKTTQMLPVWKEQYDALKDSLMKEDQGIGKKIEQFLSYLHGQTTVSKRMYS